MTEDVSPTRRAFELLADETRLAIITELGDASGEGGYATLAFSELQAAVGVDDNSRFNYHLKQLLDEFVEEKERGYGLTLAGIRAYQAVVAHGVDSSTEVAATPFTRADDCSCGGALEAYYRDGRFHAECVECGDLSFYYPVSVSNFDPDDPDSFIEAAARRLVRDESSMYDRLCPYCTGWIEWSIEPPEGHWEDAGLIDEEVLAHAACRHCAWFLYGNVAGKSRFSTVVSSFLAQRGVDPRREPPWGDHYDWSQSVVSNDPVRMELTYDLDDDRLTVVVDESLRVVDHTLEAA